MFGCFLLLGRDMHVCVCDKSGKAKTQKKIEKKIREKGILMKIPLFQQLKLFINVFTGNEEILDHSGSFRTLIDPNRRKLIRRAKMKSLRISVAIVTTFIICWTPYYVMMITVLFFIPNRHVSLCRKFH